MTPQQENEAISVWAGLECRCSSPADYVWRSHPDWYDCPRHSNNGLPPDYDRDEVAVTLLPVIMDKGYAYQLNGWKYYSLMICKISPVTWYKEEIVDIDEDFPTIAAAIKAAVMQLIEKET